jgi:alanine racemase
MLLRKTIDTLLGTFEKTYKTHNRIEVSQSALLHNVGVFEQLSNLRAIPVLKGNAYGHGITVVAEALKSRKFPYIAVDGYFEALRVRKVSRQPVLIMGAILPSNYPHLRYDNFAFVVQDADSIKALGRTGKRVNVHLEVNTGMNRYGADTDDVTRLTKLILSYPSLTLEGVMSHLADSDGDNRATVDTAVGRFDECVETVRASGGHPTILHVAQSAGSVKADSKYANMFRLGIGLYGVNPFPHGHKLHTKLQDLQPAMRLISTITKVTNLKKGDRVSYNYTFTAPTAVRIGVLPLGYYEGLNRALSNVGTVKIGKQFTPIVGLVCMNHTMISLNNIQAKVGDEVVVYSNKPADKNAVDSIAQEHKLFSYNLLTNLSTDVRRILVP